MDKLVFSENADQLFAAHSRFMGAVRDVAKDQDGYGYKYADLSQLLDVARPLLEEHGLSLVQFSSFECYTPDRVVSLPEVKGFTPHLIGDVSVQTVLTHESGQWMRGDLVLPVETKKGLSVAQCVGMGITYGRRYQAAGVLGIAQADDDAAHGPAEPARGGQSKPANSKPANNGQGRGAATPATSNSGPKLTAPDAQALADRVTAIGRDASSFARAVANVSRVDQIPQSKMADAAAMIGKAEKAFQKQQEQAAANASEPAGPDEGGQAAADAG